MPPVGFKLAISAGERPKTYVLDRPATGTDIFQILSGLSFFVNAILICYCCCNISKDSNAKNLSQGKYLRWKHQPLCLFSFGCLNIAVF